MNFELFGKQAPKTVNNFLAFCSGDFSYYMKYRESKFHKVIPGRFLLGGDFINQDGTGSLTVYKNQDGIEQDNIQAEKNSLKFKEPYLLAASANSEGRVGSQFMITLASLPALNGSNHTIFGRLISGKDVLDYIEGANDFKKHQAIIQKKSLDEIPDAKVVIRNCGVYKFEERAANLRRRSAVGEFDFNPTDFYESRRNK